MPNWCINRFDITGEQTELDKFMEENVDEGGRLSFSLSIPMPVAVRESEGWVNWAQDNWGTKWDIADDDCDHTRESDAIGALVDSWVFSTAWAPPSAWLEKVAAKYPTLRFSLWFDEPGMCFSGGEHYANGVLDAEQSWYSEECYYSADCSIENCEEDVDFLTAEDRQDDKGEKEYRPFCDNHELYGMVEKAASEDAGETVN